MSLWKLVLLSALLCSCIHQPVGTQGKSGNVSPIAFLPGISGDYFSIQSAAAGRTYHVFVKLPESYGKNPSATYPVVYILDGDSLFPLLAPTYLFLTYDEQLPEAILVGIAYGGFDPSINKRNIDFNAPAADGNPGEDGAPRFLSFLKNELIPKVESSFRVASSRRILLGQSRGGYFVLWSALEDPDLFWARIASNPALSPGRKRFFDAAAAHAKNDGKVIIASGTRDSEAAQANAQEFAAAWSNRPDAPWSMHLLRMQNGTHAATIGESYRQAMLLLFQPQVTRNALPH